MNILVKIVLVTAVTSAAITSQVYAKEQINTVLGEQKKGLLQKVFNTTSRAAVGACTITAINGMTLTCTNDEAIYSVELTEGTQIRRRFWGKSELSELKVGDHINVIGHWANDAHTIINAKHVRDTSIQIRLGVFFGKILSATADGWVMSTDKRGNPTVTVDASTTFVNRNQELITKSDIQVGHRVRIKGLWDKLSNTITKVVEVKDFSIPEQENSKNSVKPTVTITLTPTP